jgi:hypothetical protein
MTRIALVASLALLGCEQPPVRSDPHTEDTDVTVPDQPDLSYTVGSCSALVAPADLSTEVARAAARELVLALDPNHLPTTAGLLPEARWADAALCTNHHAGYGWSAHVDAPDGCLAEDGSLWWGAADVTWSLMRFSAVGSRLSTRAPNGALLQVDGAMQVETNGQTGNPDFTGSAEVYVRSGEGAWYIAFDKADRDPMATGYVHHIAGDTGPLGDFCFEATYDGRLLTEVSFLTP